jgi:hypothetical protein
MMSDDIRTASKNDVLNTGAAKYRVQRNDENETTSRRENFARESESSPLSKK